ncbi:MAG: transglycosylase SLT domain-containing protein [Kiritimatiellae bacterium]|nr:transglycosylase SLT domain-containing protein [Kiritimatiellia bacterium]
MSRVSIRIALKVVYWNFVAAVLLVSFGGAMVLQRVHRYDTLLVAVGGKHGVPAQLLSAVIWKESRFDASQVGPKEEIGLMQVTEAAAADWARSQRRDPPSRIQLFEPELNVEVGAWYLARAIRYWEARMPDPLPPALAEYNAGRSNAERWASEGQSARAYCDAVTYPTTRRYIEDILHRYRRGL